MMIFIILACIILVLGLSLFFSIFIGRMIVAKKNDEIFKHKDNIKSLENNLSEVVSYYEELKTVKNEKKKKMGVAKNAKTDEDKKQVVNDIVNLNNSKLSNNRKKKQ